MNIEKLRQRIATAIQQRELFIAQANQEAARFLGQIQAMEGMLAEMQAETTGEPTEQQPTV